MKKLVRDNIPHIMAAQYKDEDLTFSVSHPDRLYSHLWKKLDEEVAELKSSKTESEFSEEIGDVLEVLKCLVKQSSFKNTSWDKIIQQANHKAGLKGSFTKGYLLDTTDLT